MCDCPNAEQSGSPGILELDKWGDAAKAIPDAGQDGSEGDDAEGDGAKEKDSAEKPEAVNNGDEDPTKTRSAEKLQSGLPETANLMDSDGDIMMNDNRLHGNATTSIPPPLNDQPLASSPAPANATPASTSGVDAASTNDSPPSSSSDEPAAMPTSTSGDNSPPAPSTKHPLLIAPASLASARSSTHRSNEGAPAFLSPATLAHLHGALLAEAWQNLITTFLCFEKASPPTGVCFYCAGFVS